MRATFTVEVEVNRLQGKFASKDEVMEQVQQALDEANPGEVEAGFEGSQYEVVSWDVSRSDA